MSDGPDEILLRPPAGFWTPASWTNLYFMTAPVLLPIDAPPSGSGKMDQQQKSEQGTSQDTAPKPHILGKTGGYAMIFGRPVMMPAKLLQKRKVSKGQ